MNTKKWSLLSIIFILIGLAGMAYEGFRFTDKLPYFEKQWQLDSIQELRIKSGSNVDMEFIASQDGSNYIEVSGNMKQELIDKLESSELSGPKVSLDLTNPESWSFFTVDFQSTNQSVTVALADAELMERLQVELSHSNGTFSGLQANRIELTTLSGNLKLDSASAEQLDMETTSGNITLSALTGSAKLKVISGNIKADSVQGDLQVEGFSGNITIRDLQGSGVIKNTSGNVKLEDQRSDQLDITVTSGNVTLSKDQAFKGIYDLKANSGTIKAPDSPMETTDMIKIRANSGNIRID
ncbi:DUF4097 family beta strand repeat-containing protein [Paenibacillus brevis]|uniref:DUF4097 domain-containing protein n=1 Tax=Paenibacillus brevis TaxID=2841508 RepID=A0ABS6FKW7_9BACL|nr:DUF4097 family beta strand repeat-containing protein [Paenibacillus brevis]MBU5670823.1 DUF4097 domain-containing protein [Paenibacillus brevis]